MKLISHRGNICGPNPESENTECYILNAVKAGYDVEIDLWLVNGKLYLGHDHPDTITTTCFLNNLSENLWVHCKNIQALSFLLEHRVDLNYFFHNSDDATLTSDGWIWTYPNSNLFLMNKSIAVLPEKTDKAWNLSLAGGICSDYIINYK